MESRTAANGRQSQQSRCQSADESSESAMNPAIFIPITTFPPQAAPHLSTQPEQSLTSEQKLQRIVSNLTWQHESVKQNMYIVVKERVKELRRAAQAELDALGDIADDAQSSGMSKDLRKKINETVMKMKTEIKEGTNIADFEVKPSQHIRTGATLESNPTSSRTPSVIRAEVVMKVQELIDSSVEEVIAYENHAKQKIAHYQSLLAEEQRRTRNPGYGNITSDELPSQLPTERLAKRKSVSFDTKKSPLVASPGEKSTASSKGILKQGTVQSPVDHEKLRMMDLDHGSEMDLDDNIDAAAERKRRENGMRRRQEERELENIRNQALKHRAERQGKS